MNTQLHEDFLKSRQLSHGRRVAIARLLAELDGWLAPRPPADATAEDVTAFLASKLEAGFRPNTVRKWLAMARTFYTWLYEGDEISAETLLGIRAIPMPAGSSALPKPQPYSLKELRELRAIVSTRWPLLPRHEAWRRAVRWSEGRSPYSRIRSHAIRLQTEAIVSLALELGLRRSEIFALSIDAIHHDHAYVVVWRNGAEWCADSREVPFTTRARAAVQDWLEFRAILAIDHDQPWVQLWSGVHVGAPMKRDAFEKLLRTYIGEGCTFKRLRDTCAVCWLDAGLAIEHTRRLLGVASLDAILPYAALVSGTVDSAMSRVEEQLEPGGSLALA